MPADGDGPGVPADAALVRRLLAAEFPQWADLPVRPAEAAGTDNAIFRLGADMVVRLPRRSAAAAQVDKEARWLPRLAPRLPLAIPLPLGRGRPAEGYPWPWSVCRWLPGEPASVAPIADLRAAAAALGTFVAALRRVDPSGGPPAGPLTGGRGLPLAVRDAQARAAIASLRGTFDARALTAAWERCLQAPAWQGPAVWFHGDLHAANLLVDHGRVSAVIDFGLAGTGDPACELIVAWSLVPAEHRGVFRRMAAVDAATWARGRGWALAWAVIAFAYYRSTGHVLARISRGTIEAVLAERQCGW